MATATITTTFRKGAVKGVGCATGLFTGFRDFVLRGNVVDLAVAVVVGSAFTSLISAVVSDWLTPFIAVIFGKNDGTFGSKQFVIRGSVFNYGHFINQLLSFICVCTALYFFVVLPLNSLLKVMQPAKKTRSCPECLSDIPKKATRCKFCCVEVPPPPPSRKPSVSHEAVAAEKSVVSVADPADPEAGVKEQESGVDHIDPEQGRKASAAAASDSYTEGAAKRDS